VKILFLGGTGNISADCAALLHQRGHEIQVVSRGHSPVPPQYRALRAERKDPAALRAAVRSAAPEVVINFLGYELSDVQTDYELFQGEIRQYLFISSTSVYARPSKRLPLTEDAALGNCFWEYARLKQACEEWLGQRWAQERFPVTIVRPSHTYSRQWIPNPLSSSSYTFAARLEQGQAVYVPDNGENPWTLTATADFAVGLAGLVGHPAALGEVFQITSDEVLTWNGIYAEIAAALGVSAPTVVPVPTDFICQVAPQMTGTLKGDKAQPGVFDNSKIKRFVPEFQGRKPFRVGVHESVAWLRENPARRTVNPQLDALCAKVVAAWQQRQSKGAAG
jgi:nucleoside-diphosphate-sugar epimerase